MDTLPFETNLNSRDKASSTLFLLFLSPELIYAVNGVFVSTPSFMQFLWEQMVIISCDGIICCIVPQLTFCHSSVPPMDFPTSVHDSTTLLIFYILLYNVELRRFM